MSQDQGNFDDSVHDPFNKLNVQKNIIYLKYKSFVTLYMFLLLLLIFAE